MTTAEPKVVTGHTGRVTALSVGAGDDGERIYSGGEDGAVLLWILEAMRASGPKSSPPRPGCPMTCALLDSREVEEVVFFQRGGPLTRALIEECVTGRSAT